MTTREAAMMVMFISTTIMMCVGMMSPEKESASDMGFFLLEMLGNRSTYR